MAFTVASPSFNSPRSMKATQSTTHAGDRRFRQQRLKTDVESDQSGVIRAKVVNQFTLYLISYSDPIRFSTQTSREVKCAQKLSIHSFIYSFTYSSVRSRRSK